MSSTVCRVKIFVAAAYPEVTSNTAESCILQGQNVTLTCRFTYNGTHLMPPVVHWYKYRSWGFPDDFIATNTTNGSAVYESSLTFIAAGQTTDNYMCRVSFSRPTGVVLSGTSQSNNIDDHYTSSPFFTRDIASENSYEYMLTVFVDFSAFLDLVLLFQRIAYLSNVHV